MGSIVIFSPRWRRHGRASLRRGALSPTRPLWYARRPRLSRGTGAHLQAAHRARWPPPANAWWSSGQGRGRLSVAGEKDKKEKFNAHVDEASAICGGEAVHARCYRSAECKQKKRPTLRTLGPGAVSGEYLMRRVSDVDDARGVQLGALLESPLAGRVSATSRHYAPAHDRRHRIVHSSPSRPDTLRLIGGATDFIGLCGF
ncbi:hypothetical protein EVAR_31026_1 [Eumeta japonica]|uniref:Uncharacterized protein n=1 Tax=Eumeta variegata TaxID=151549 RepID=A0A4C1VD04_EUMVA|nr:hypothetical protein EVAR_31026_1 [Eumeta japonica]